MTLFDDKFFMFRVFILALLLSIYANSQFDQQAAAPEITENTGSPIRNSLTEETHVENAPLNTLENGLVTEGDMPKQTGDTHFSNAGTYFQNAGKLPGIIDLSSCKQLGNKTICEI
jgi:hypothetical protein